MRRLVLLAIVISSISCGPKAPPPTVGADGATLSPCQRLQRAHVGDGSLIGVFDQLKRDFPDWAQPPQGASSAKVPWVGLPFTVVCDVEAYNQITVAQATCGDVHALLTDPSRWSEVYTNAYAIEAPPTLTPGARFSLRTFGSGQDCTVLPESGFLLGWSCDDTYLVPIPTFGALPLARIQQIWSCTESNGGIVIATQECQVGRGVKDANEFVQSGIGAMLQRGHQAWLEGLKCKLDDGAWSVKAGR